MEETKQIIKELYNELLETARVNHPDVYLMPVSVYNKIVDRISYLDRALGSAKTSRDNWKKKYYEVKNG